MLVSFKELFEILAASSLVIWQNPLSSKFSINTSIIFLFLGLVEKIELC